MKNQHQKHFLESLLFYIPLAIVLYLITNSIIAGLMGALSVFFVPFFFKKKTKN